MTHADSSTRSGLPAARRPGPLVIAIVFVAFAVLCALGTWQVQRLQWKEGLIAKIESRIAAQPLTLDGLEAVWAEEGDVEYTPVQLSGRFLYGREQHFLATHEGQSGWYVYTPLELEDGRHLIVNRGFVPYDMKDPVERNWTEPEGDVAFTALARDPLYEKPGWVVPDNAPGDNLWYWKDYPAMREAMGLDADSTLPFFADVRAYEGDVPPLPVPGVTRISLPNNHLQYAITWYGLAGALAAVFGFMFLRKPEANRIDDA